MYSLHQLLSYRHLFVYHSYSGANKGNEFGVFAIIFPATNNRSSEITEEEEEGTEDQSSVSKAHFVFIRGAASVTKGILTSLFFKC